MLIELTCKYKIFPARHGLPLFLAWIMPMLSVKQMTNSLVNLLTPLWVGFFCTQLYPIVFLVILSFTCNKFYCHVTHFLLTFLWEKKVFHNFYWQIYRSYAFKMFFHNFFSWDVRIAYLLFSAKFMKIYFWICLYEIADDEMYHWYILVHMCTLYVFLRNAC